MATWVTNSASSRLIFTRSGPAVSALDSRKQLVARGATGETNPCWNRAQAFERHGDVRGLASGVAINFCDAIDAARKKSVQYKPRVDRGIQAHAKECGCEAMRVCS